MDDDLTLKMELVDSRFTQDWIEFGNPPNEKAVEFMMKHYGFPNIEHLSDDECLELADKLHDIESTQHHLAETGIDRKKYGYNMRRPLSEYALMIGGMIKYIGEQFQTGGKRHNPTKYPGFQ